MRSVDLSVTDADCSTELLHASSQLCLLCDTCKVTRAILLHDIAQKILIADLMEYQLISDMLGVQFACRC
jgi:hypothetical protein